VLGRRIEQQGKKNQRWSKVDGEDMNRRKAKAKR
jgi:hypothetical protein